MTTTESGRFVTGPDARPCTACDTAVGPAEECDGAEGYCEGRSPRDWVRSYDRNALIREALRRLAEDPHACRTGFVPYDVAKTAVDATLDEVEATDLHFRELLDAAARTTARTTSRPHRPAERVDPSAEGLL